MPDGARLAPDELARSQPDRMPNLSREGSATVRRAADEVGCTEQLSALALPLHGAGGWAGHCVVADFRVGTGRRQAPMEIVPFHTWAARDGSPWLHFYRLNGGYLLRFPELADFEVSAAADDLVCFPAPDASEATVEHLYLSQVRPLV